MKFNKETIDKHTILRALRWFIGAMELVLENDDIDEMEFAEPINYANWISYWQQYRFNLYKQQDDAF